MTDRKGDWMQTYTGKQFWPLDPRPEEVCIYDIAHALANMCRYNGHCVGFYSVAQHSVLVSENCSPEHALWGLLHDATEAYLPDVIRPLKQHMPEFQAIEAKVHDAIAARFGLPREMPAEVKTIDRRILADEQLALMAPCEAEWRYGSDNPLGLPIVTWEPWEAEAEFLYIFDVLEATRRMPAQLELPF